MAQRESQLSRKIMNTLRSEGHFCFKVHGSEHMMAGLPDIIVCADGFFIGLETKNPESRNDTSARQVFVHEQIQLSGGRAVVVTSSEEALHVVNEWLRSKS
jgi:Holliday junction resolvase